MAPLILALVLGPMMEKTLRQSLFMARGDVGSILFRPIPAVLYSVAIAVMVFPPLYRRVKKNSKVLLQ
jgi:putative tricarboxylic transport membrane protein